MTIIVLRPSIECSSIGCFSYVISDSMAAVQKLAGLQGWQLGVVLQDPPSRVVCYCPYHRVEF